MPKRNVVLLVVTCLVSLVALAARERNDHARRFGEVLTAIERNYYRPVDGERLYRTAVEAAVGSLDEHSAHLQGQGREELEASLDQEFGGVGLELALDATGAEPIVVTPVFNSPAWRAGVAAGDTVVAVDGQATRGRPLRETVERLRGVIGEPVGITILPAAARATLDPAELTSVVGPARELVLIREAVAVESVQGDRRLPDGTWDWWLEGVPGVAYVRIGSFGERTAVELATALDSIAGRGLPRGLVVDLRGNPGGLLDAAVAVCDEFLDDGVIVATRSRRGADAGRPDFVEERLASGDRRLADVPLAVLVDGLSASAAEIVAACLQDAGRATVVGSRTFGKGTVQSLLPLSDGRSLLKLTTSEYLRPSRENIDRRPGVGDDEAWGVRPTAGYEVTPTAEAADRLRGWRRRRDVVPPPGGGTTATDGPMPAEIDAVLARALEAFSTSADRSGS